MSIWDEEFLADLRALRKLTFLLNNELQTTMVITGMLRSLLQRRGEEHAILDDDTNCGLREEASVKDQSLRVLHVEDNKVVADAVRDTLETEGWQVETYADGAVALTKIAGQTHYDLLLLDYDLPNVSGIELVRRARNLTHRHQTPIIVLSAGLGEAEARKVGADMFLHKPEDIRVLVETINGLLSSAEDMET